jgi:hypothetical protein
MYFSRQDDAFTTMLPTTTMQSIFSSREKSSVARQIAFQPGELAPGYTTTVVMAKGGEMIDGIPVGEVVMRLSLSARISVSIFSAS